MAQKKFLVTGATGASGVHTVEQLLGRGSWKTACDRSSRRD